MSILRKDKNSGLSEQQRLQQAMYQKRMQESRDRLSLNLEAFRGAYKEIVLRFGIKFIPKMEFDQFRGVFPVIVEQECKDEVDQVKKRIEEQVKRTEGDGVIKN